MAYMNQEKKAALAPKIKAVLKKYNMKGSIGVRHHSTLVVNLSTGRLDILNNYIHSEQNSHEYLRVNEYHIEYHYTGDIQKFLTELKDAMMQSDDGSVKNHDRSDSQSDYFDVGWYIDINVGQFQKPYKLITK
jgi:hypothetical protein